MTFLNKMKRVKGFTLIELLVVIAIIGLLATLAVVALNNARTKSRDAKRVSDIKQIQTALELYYLDNNDYPPLGTSPAVTAEVGTGNACTSAVCNCIDEDGITNECDTNGTTYMGLIPGDPSDYTAGACNSGSGSTACNYGYYAASSAAQSYVLYFHLEDKVNDLVAGINCASENGIVSGGTCP